jgi:Bardet-Biedl syndrome 9 protein
MSIFESKEFWSTSVSKNKEEEFDRNSISTGIIEQSQKTCVSVGSFSGNLRIYTPSFGDNSSNTLKFSKKFEEPILQTEIGNFTRANNNIDQLAILLIHRLFVIKFKDFKPGNNSIEFEHKLKRNGHNLTKARVGDKNYDIIFVQSIDGAISIYEGENFINMVVLSEVYFPGQMGYLNTKDSLVISNTAYEIECYSFNSLATLKNDNSSQIVKQFNHIWKVNLGELSTQIQIVFNKINKREEIVVLTETLLNLINSNGTLLYQKKLDFEPMCFYAYNITDDNYIKNQIFDLMCLISSTYHHIMIYKGFQLAWVAKVFDTPIYISLNNFENIQSLIVTLNDFGNLNVLYLGMEKIKNMKLIKTKDIDPKKMVKEREKLTQIINSYEKGIFINDKENALKINALVHKEIFYVKGRDDNKVFHKDNYGKILESLVQLEFEYGSQEANDIYVNIICPYNIICDDPIFVIPSLGSNSNNNIKKNLKFRVIEQYYPTFITIDVYTSYYAIEKNEKIIKSSSISFELPLGLFVKVENEAKSNLKFSITLETDKPSMKLNDIFDDLDQSFPDYDLIKNKSNSVLFVYPNKKEVAVNLGKAKGTYSIESDNFESILFILNQIVYRLKEKYKDINYWINDKFKVKDYFFRVKDHYELIQKKKDLLKNLEKYTSLYTNLQKNLLNKYQKKTPPKLANIDFFLKNVYKDIVAESDLVQKTNNEIKSLYRDIYIWTESIIYLTKLRARLNDEEYQLLKSVFPLDNINNNENNWEDITYYNMINLDLYYFEEKEKLKEISGNIDFDQWEKEFRNILSSILTRKGIFNKQKLNNSSNISESSNVKNSTNND